jgi:hypothetical protein
MIYGIQAGTNLVVSYADFLLVSLLYFIERFDKVAYKKLMSLDPALIKLYEASRQWFAKDT